VAFKTGQHFEMKIDTAKVWGKTITLNPVDSVVGNTTIQIRYNPTVPSYSSVHADTLLFSTTAGDYASIAASGTSTRAIYVVPPVATDASDVTFASFVANWNSVYDATGYYITVYHVANGESSLTEGFDNGLTASTDWTITAKSISNSTAYSGTNAPSIQFSNTGEYVETENYIVPITKVSFYIRSLGGSNGGFLVEAQNDQNVWEKVDSIPVTSVLNQKSQSYSFLETKGYDRLRFTYIKGVGSLTFDDVTVTLSKQLNYNLRENWVTSTLDTISNLLPSTTYSYKVRASDKSSYYENITDFSNVISQETMSYPLETKLVVSKDINSNVTVNLPSLGSTLYVYNILGQCIKTIIPSQTTIVISGLQKNQVYIIKSNNRVTKIVL